MTTTANPFTTASAAARQRGSNDTAQRIEMEGKIARKLVQQALAAGYLVSVYDGEEWPLKLSASMPAILAAMSSTDGDTLVIRDPRLPGDDGRFKRVGSVDLIYGNSGYDVISDYASSDLDAFSAWMEPIEEYAEKLELEADAATDSDDEHDGADA